MLGHPNSASCLRRSHDLLPYHLQLYTLGLQSYLLRRSGCVWVMISASAPPSEAPFQNSLQTAERYCILVQDDWHRMSQSVLKGRVHCFFSPRIWENVSESLGVSHVELSYHGTSWHQLRLPWHARQRTPTHAHSIVRVRWIRRRHRRWTRRSSSLGRSTRP